MAIATEQLKHFMDSLGGSPEDNLKMLLYYGDLGGDFTNDEDWGALCEFALAVDEELGMSQAFSSRYSELIGRKEFQSAMDAMEYDLMDNKIFAGMAIHNLGLPKKMPMVAAAAFNKHSYKGLKDEFALVRFLHWSGFDINAAKEPNAMSPLHLFSSTKVIPGTHPRAVEWLLEREADVEAINAKGDTAMAYLCGTQGWGEHQSRSFVALLKAGSNPFAKAEDGTTPYALLRQMNEAEFSQDRAHVMAGVEAIREAMEKTEAAAVSEDDEDEVEVEVDANQRLAAWLVQIGERIEEIRGFYLDEEAQAENRDDWNTTDGEQYLKRIYQVTMGFALRNNLYGRPEFYSDEVVAVLSGNADLAKFFNPHVLLPIIDLIHERVVAKLVTTIARPDQAAYAKGVIESLRTSQELRDLIMFQQDEEAESIRDLWGERRFGEVEAMGFGPVARHAVWIHLSGLFGSGWGDGFMGLPMKSEYPHCFASEIAAHVANRRKARDGEEGRALVLALIGLMMELSQGLLVGQSVPEDAWRELSPGAWCEGAGSYSGQAAVLWGLETTVFPDGKDVELEELTDPEALAFLEMMKNRLAEAAPTPTPTPPAEARPEANADSSSPGKKEASMGAPANDPPGLGSEGDLAGAVNDVDGIPPELMAAARAYRIKGGSLGAFGRWAFNSKNPTQESAASDLEFEIKWAKRHMGTPKGNQIIADARKAPESKDAS